jgi:hypothetical protein
LTASVARYIRELQTQDPQAQASAGMSAFGDLILCVGVFCFVALAPTGVAIFFVMPWGKIQKAMGKK